MEEGSLLEHANFLGLGSLSSIGLSYKTKTKNWISVVKVSKAVARTVTKSSSLYVSPSFG